MALPDSRNTTYAPLSQVLSADLNAVQDSIASDAHPEQRKVLSPVDYGYIAGAQLFHASTGPENGPVGFFGSVGDRVYVPVVLRGGSILESIFLRASVDSTPLASPADVRLLAHTIPGTPNGAPVVIASTTIPTPVANYDVGFDSSDPAFPLTIDPDIQYVLDVSTTGSGSVSFGATQLIFRRPLVAVPA